MYDLARFAARRIRILTVLGALLACSARTSDAPANQPAATPVQFDLFIMSHCPFSSEAVLAALSWKEKLGDQTTLKIHYIAREVGEPPAPEETGPRLPKPIPVAKAMLCEDEGFATPSSPGERFQSLHGPAEVEEDLRQLVLQEYFPDLFHQYLRQYYAAYPDSDWRKACVAVEVDPDAVEALVDAPQTAEEFSRNIEHVRSLGIRSSPTLLIDGEYFPFPITRWSLGRYLCRRSRAGEADCGEIPRCGNDLDCAKEGFVGECRFPDSVSAECVFTEPAETTLTFIPAEDCEICDSSPVITLLREFLPLLDVRTISAASEEAREIIDRLGIKYSPAYVLPREIETFPRFETYRTLLTPFDEHYAVDWEWLSAVVVIEREPNPGRIDLIGGSLSPQAAFVRRWFREHLPDVVLHERLYLPPSPHGEEEVLILQPGEDGIWKLTPAGGKFQSPRGETEIEENLFELALLAKFPQWFSRYRACVDAHLGRGQDHTTCRGVIEVKDSDLGLDRSAREELQHAQTESVESLGLEIGRFALLIDNRILVRDFDEAIRAWLLQRFKSPSAPLRKGG